MEFQVEYASIDYAEMNWAFSRRKPFRFWSRCVYGGALILASCVVTLQMILESPATPDRWSFLPICIFCLLLGLVFFPLSGPRFMALLRWKSVKKRLGGFNQCRIDSNGVWMKTQHAEAQMNWSLFDTFWETKQQFTLFQGNSGYMVPKRVLSNEMQDELRSLLKSNIRSR